MQCHLLVRLRQWREVLFPRANDRPDSPQLPAALRRIGPQLGSRAMAVIAAARTLPVMELRPGLNDVRRPAALMYAYIVLSPLQRLLAALRATRADPQPSLGAAGLLHRRHRGVPPPHPWRARHRGRKHERAADPGRRPCHLRLPGHPRLPDRLPTGSPPRRAAGLPALPPSLWTLGRPAPHAGRGRPIVSGRPSSVTAGRPEVTAPPL